MGFVKSSKGPRATETWRKCLLLNILYIFSRDLCNHFCVESELSVIIVTKQLHCSNRLLVSLHYVCVVCLLGHAVQNRLIWKCKGLKSVMAAVVFITYSLGYGRDHDIHLDRVRVSPGSRISVLSPRDSALPSPSYDWWHQFQTCLCDISEWKSCLPWINALSYI